MYVSMWVVYSVVTLQYIDPYHDIVFDARQQWDVGHRKVAIVVDFCADVVAECRVRDVVQ